MSTSIAQTLSLSARSWISSDLTRVGPYWLQWVWTGLFSVVLAVVFAVLGFFVFNPGKSGLGSAQGWLYWFSKNLVVTSVISALIHLLFDGAGRVVGGPTAIRHWNDVQRSLFFGGIPILGLLIGWPLGITLSGSADVVFPILKEPRGLLASITLCLGISVGLHFYFAAKGKQIAAEARATEAQLRLLQGQIEPHFLFNTLAGVIALIDHDTARAKHTLQTFTEYLRSSLATLRRDEGPLAQELELAQNYLLLMQARMEDRLTFRIEADDAARRATLPPLLLQPLVENAVQHGLERSIQGGEVIIRAHALGGQLVLEVCDNGLGMDAPPRRAHGPGGASNGVALSNVRSRLRTRWGDAARLELHAALPGTRAVITLPLEAAPGGSQA
jgi:hypothetical protein